MEDYRLFAMQAVLVVAFPVLLLIVHIINTGEVIKPRTGALALLLVGAIYLFLGALVDAVAFVFSVDITLAQGYIAVGFFFLIAYILTAKSRRK